MRWKPPRHGGRNLHFGVREHAMAAVAGGMALHGGVIPYAATFLTFSDYMRPPMRLAAMMGIRVIYVFTHDSIGLGEDGPTHQPIEQLMGLRSIPGLTVIRPADAVETAEAWRAALLRDSGPTALILTRQDVPMLDRGECAPAEGLHRGAYVLWESFVSGQGGAGGSESGVSDSAVGGPSASDGPAMPDVILIGTGSEVSLALEAGRKLAREGFRVRVVSMPSWELFDAQPPEYRQRVLPAAVEARVAVEAGIRLGWEHYVGLRGCAVGMNGFGASAPADVLFEKFGVTTEAVVHAARRLLT